MRSGSDRSEAPRDQLRPQFGLIAFNYVGGCVGAEYSRDESDESNCNQECGEADVDHGSWRMVERKRRKTRKSTIEIDEEQRAHTLSRI